MPAGDDALAAGMPIMDGTEQADTLDTEMNITRDLIAQRETVIDGETSAADARAALEVSHKVETVELRNSPGYEMWFETNGTTTWCFVNGVIKWHLP